MTCRWVIRGPWISLALVVMILGAGIGDQGYFLDGQIYAALGRNIAAGEGVLAPKVGVGMQEGFFHHPPLVLWLEALWFKALGASWASGRFFAMAWLLALLACTHRFAREALGQRIAWAGTLLLSLTWPLLRWSRHPNLDVPLAVFSVLALHAIWRASTQRSRRDWLWAGMWFGLALWTKGYAALFLPLAAVAWLIVSGRLHVLGRAGPWLAVVLGLALFGLWPLVLTWNGHAADFMAYVERPFVAQDNPWLTDPGPWVVVRRLFGKALPTTVLALLGLAVLLRNRARNHAGWLLVAWVVALLVAVHAASPRLPHWIVPVYPALAILGGMAWPGLPKGLRRCGQLLARMAPFLVMSVSLFPSGQRVYRDAELHVPISVGVSGEERRVDRVMVLRGRHTPWLNQAAAAFPHGLPVRELSIEELDAALQTERSERWILAVTPEEARGLSEAARGVLATDFLMCGRGETGTSATQEGQASSFRALGYFDKRLRRAVEPDAR